MGVKQSTVTSSNDLQVFPFQFPLGKVYPWCCENRRGEMIRGEL
jgi:hypothetical protein